MDTGVAPYRNNSATAIWSRLIEPDQGNLTPDAARAWLRLAFSEDDGIRLKSDAKRYGLSCSTS